MPLPLTITIPTKNEEANLSGCLKAIGHDLAERVVLIDSGSTDQTKEIAAKWGVEVIDFQWNGQFPKKRNWFLREHKPKTDWVLFLDADEYLTPEFQRELTEVIRYTNKNGFWLNYSIHFLGKPLKGGYPLKKLALFRVGSGEYERIDENAWSHLDMEIHEHPMIEGSVGEIKSRIDHRDFRGVEAWAKKHAEYASWEAKRFLAQTTSTHSNSWTFKQRIKYKLIDSPWLAPIFFLGCFFWMRGFLDGKRGFTWACLKAGYFAQVYARIQEEKLKQKESTEGTDENT